MKTMAGAALHTHLEQELGISKPVALGAVDHTLNPLVMTHVCAADAPTQSLSHQIQLSW